MYSRYLTKANLDERYLYSENDAFFPKLKFEIFAKKSPERERRIGLSEPSHQNREVQGDTDIDYES